MKICRYDDKYRSGVRDVCLITGPDDAPTDKRVGTYILNCYCNYYIECEPGNCFVLVNEDDEAVGYTLCAENYRNYRKNSKPYLKIARENAGREKAEIAAEQFALRLFSKKYPAHLHIDIRPGYTGSGFGTELIRTLLSHLKDKGVPAVMLTVGSGNREAIRFYERNGFKIIVKAFGGTVMGINLRI